MAMVAPAPEAGASADQRSPASPASPADSADVRDPGQVRATGHAKSPGKRAEAPPKARTDAPGQTKTATKSSGGGRKITLEEEFLVEGKLEKPNAFYILKRSQAEYDWARLDAKFLPLVLESVQDPLF
jgi:hypothetical protein